METTMTKIEEVDLKRLTDRQARLETERIVAEVLSENYKPLTNALDMITSELTVIPNVMVTPDMARDFLSRNNRNRPIRSFMIARYVGYQQKGVWMFAGNTITFNKNGEMINGQHTLIMGIRTNTTVHVNIQLGLEPKAQGVIDSGTPRTGSDVVALQGYTNHSAIASAIKSTIYFETVGSLRTSLQYSKVSNAEIEAWTEKKQDMKLLVKCIDHSVKLKEDKRVKMISPSLLGFAYYLFSKQNHAQATDFVDKLVSGENLSMKETPAVFLLREELQQFNERHSKRELTTGGSYVAELKIKYMIRAWNAFRTKENITKLVIDKGGKIELPV